MSTPTMDWCQTMDWSQTNVLVTGGTGSFGQKFTEVAVRRLDPRKLIVLSRDEWKQSEMRVRFPDDRYPCVRYFLGDVRDRERLYRAFAGVDVVVHAAALKQVPACEYNPIEAIQTNIIGARNVIDAAIDRGVRRVIAISTDKAVNPVNLYGATKLCAEKLFVHGNSYSGEGGTRFACARYGNVVGSRGSVIPLFREARKTGRVSVTDPRMTRFWITLDFAVDFVVRCIEGMHGGEIFVPKIPSMNIMDVARTVAPECAVDTIGIRPGEKLHEVLVAEDEARDALEMDDSYVILPHNPLGRRDDWPGGRALPDGFRYASDTNPRRLEVSELERLLECH